jgi:hypothetical protein
MTRRRRFDWQLRLAAFGRERERMPFEWGRNDCCLFSADAVLAMTESDAAHAYRGYSTALEAQRLLELHGGAQGLATQAWGEPVAPAFAAVGDVVLVMNEGRKVLAICNGTNAMSAGTEGIEFVGMDTAILAWKI